MESLDSPVEFIAGDHLPGRRDFMGIGNIGLPGLLLIAVVVLVLFGRGKISSLMGEVGKGITAFKKGVDEGKQELEEQKVESAKDVTPAAEEDKDKV
jgi:sec-independent protein translocase protein TatA